MDLANVEIFLAVAEKSGITRAARALGRVPSNVTVRVQQLERELGATLFNRDGRKMTLTDEGAAFLTYARRLLALSAEARAALRPAAASGPLRVGAMESTAASRLPDVLTSFRRRWPEVSLQLTMGPTRELARAVLDGALDCALVAQPPADLRRADAALGVDLFGLSARRVFVEEVMIVAPSGHPDIRSAADLEVDMLAALEPGCTYRRIAEHWGRSRHGLRTMELNSYHAMLAIVAAGNVVGVAPRSVLDLIRQPAGTTVHPLASVDTLLVRRRGEPSPAIDAFAEALHGRPAAPVHH
ncbi:MAG: LysR family transcriptional regulator [Rhizobiaceae bacterium]|nr:LysR family transcriptional regulator [Rhizobiaceae bacterium]